MADPLHDNDGIVVQYGIKEILEGIYHRFDKVESMVDGLAKQKDLLELEHRVNKIEQEAMEIAVVAAALKADRGGRFTRNQIIWASAFMAFNFFLNITALGPDILPW